MQVKLKMFTGLRDIIVKYMRYIIKKKLNILIYILIRFIILIFNHLSLYKFNEL
jgi:hypothetical protein